MLIKAPIVLALWAAGVSARACRHKHSSAAAQVVSTPTPAPAPAYTPPAYTPAPKPAAPASYGSPAPASGTYGGQMTDTHNQARAQYGAGPLAWNSTLEAAANDALNWADSSGFCQKLTHTGQRFGPYGENIAAGTDLSQPSQVTDMWMAEAKDYHGGFTEACGHFTQVVWKGTHQVGCATKMCGGWYLTYCEYYPAGNVLGNFAENVQ